ncbi:MAG: alkaline phosphatase D family protein [Planctomycetota bacterium]
MMQILRHIVAGAGLVLIGGWGAGCQTAGPERASLMGAATERGVEVIAFASCARSDWDQTIWPSILAQDPDLFLFIGDNVYVDIPDVPETEEDFREKYRQLAAQSGWQDLTAAVPVMATWDDHDYGLNDAGSEFALKEVAQETFLDFFGFAADAPIREQEGIYHARVFGPEGRRVQVILLDTRYHRDPLTRNPAGRVDGLGPYLPNEPGRGTLLGEAQWAWLEWQLRRPADVRVVASSIQVVADEHGWETWGNMPHERDRLYRLIKETGAEGVVFVSGDRHLLEISRDDERGGPYPMWDLTSSSVNWKKGQVNDPNRFRQGGVFREPNFGVLRIDWDAEPATVRFEGRNHDGAVLVESATRLSELSLP